MRKTEADILIKRLGRINRLSLSNVSRLAEIIGVDLALHSVDFSIDKDGASAAALGEMVNDVRRIVARLNVLLAVEKDEGAMQEELALSNPDERPTAAILPFRATA